MKDTVSAPAGRFRPVDRAAVERARPNLEELQQRLVGAGEVPGLSVAVVFRDEVVYSKGAGKRRAGSADQVGIDTVFQLASLSKPIASTVVAALVGGKSVGWDTRMASIDPHFQLRDAYPTAHVTIRDLLAHRSGLFGTAGDDLEALGFTRGDILGRLRYSKPIGSFRSVFSYSNFGFTAGAAAAAQAAGLAWEDAAEALLYRPLGMASTSSRHKDFLARPDRAELHVRFNGEWTALAKRDPDAQSPAGGVSSSVRDLAEWMRLELGNGKHLIDADAIGQIHVPLMERGDHPITGTPSFYGLGWNIDYRSYGTVWGHAGAFSTGARTLVSLVPSHQLGIVVLANAFPTGVPEGVAETFLADVLDGDRERDWIGDWNRFFASLFGPSMEAAKKTFERPPANAWPALPFSAYAGTYANDFLGTVTVADADGALTIELGPPQRRRAFPAKHFDRDLFIYYPSDETPDVPSAAVFAIGPGERAGHLTLSDLNDNRQGELVRVAGATA